MDIVLERNIDMNIDIIINTGSDRDKDRDRDGDGIEIAMVVEMEIGGIDSDGDRVSVGVSGIKGVDVGVDVDVCVDADVGLDVGLDVSVYIDVNLDRKNNMTALLMRMPSGCKKHGTVTVSENIKMEMLL